MTDRSTELNPLTPEELKEARRIFNAPHASSLVLKDQYRKYIADLKILNEFSKKINETKEELLRARTAYIHSKNAENLATQLRYLKEYNEGTPKGGKGKNKKK